MQGNSLVSPTFIIFLEVTACSELRAHLYELFTELRQSNDERSTYQHQPSITQQLFYHCKVTDPVIFKKSSLLLQMAAYRGRPLRNCNSGEDSMNMNKTLKISKSKKTDRGEHQSMHYNR
uniref:Uncharacterized protein n=1 Tax=Arundo donax TaxID=35708 RepID=A0A0A9DKQ7_ARUDO